MTDPIRPEVKELMNSIAKSIDEVTPKGMGFVLLLFDFGKKGRNGFMNYISNAQRREMITTLRELIRNLETS